MKFKKISNSLIAAGILASSFALPVTGNAEGDDYYPNETNPTARPTIVLEENSIGNKLLNGEVTPMYVPIPYTYVHTYFYSNYQVGQMVNKMSPGTTSAAVAALGLITLPSAVAKPVAVAGYIVATATQNKYTYFRSAYDQGYGLQLIVRRNPNYNGYNAATLAEWVKTNSRMQ